MRAGTILKGLVIVAAAVVVAFVAVVKSIDVNQYRAAITGLVERSIGRPVAFEGAFSLELSLDPALVATEVTVANAPWGSRPEMVRIRRVEAHIGLVPLLMQKVRVNRLVLVEPDILVETDAQGRRNWSLDAPPPAQNAPFVDPAVAPIEFAVARLQIDKAEILSLNGRDGRRDHVKLERLTMATEAPSAPMTLAGAGEWNGQRFDLSGVFGNLGEALAAGKPYPVKLNAKMGGLVAAIDGVVTDPRHVGGWSAKLSLEGSEWADAALLAGRDDPKLGPFRFAARLEQTSDGPTLLDVEAAVGRRDLVLVGAKGKIADPLGRKGFDIALSVESDRTAALSDLLGTAIPALPPVKISANVTDVPEGWKLAGLRATAGRGDASGEVLVRTGGERPVIQGRLSSSLVDVAELTAGGKPVPPKGEPDHRLFSDRPLPVELLALADIQLDWTIDRLLLIGAVAEKASVGIVVEDGRAVLRPAAERLGGGRTHGRLSLDGRADPAALTLDFEADAVSLGEVLAGLALTDRVRDGRSDISVTLRGQGASPRDVMAKLDGQATLITGRALVKGANALDQLAPWRPPADDTRIECAVGRFAVIKGMATAQALLFDTNYMTMAGKGAIDLAAETMDLTMVPRPKDLSLLGLALPMDVRGPLTAPDVTPNPLPVGRDLALAAAGAPVSPLGVPLPFVNPGEVGNPCVDALAGKRRDMPGRATEAPRQVIEGLFGK
ncbi:MAG: AsmA family protein [Alphaproteobacteria bacterium]|nr:AsmA family protein [Alphaproteobacteria bacterium]